MPSDTERLDWLESQAGDYGNGWIFRRRSGGGAALHQTARNEEGVTPTARGAIDAAMDAVICPKCGSITWDQGSVDQALSKCWDCGQRWLPK